MRRADLLLPVGDRQHQRQVGDPARRVPHELPGRIVRPVQVIQHPQHRPVPGGLIDRIEQRLE